MKKSFIKWAILGVAFILVIIVGLNCCSSVGPTERGIMTTFGKPSEKWKKTCSCYFKTRNLFCSDFKTF